MCVYFFWLSANSHDLRLGMDGMLLALCTGSRDRANVSLIIIIIIDKKYIVNKLSILRVSLLVITVGTIK